MIAENSSPEERAARRLQTRRNERHGAASIRAVGDEPQAEYRARRLMVGGRPLPFAAPYLAIDFADVSLAQSRGVSDALALRLRNSDETLHRSQQPEQPFARIVFDILEQIRCESLCDVGMKGVRANMELAFDAWCQQSRRSGFVETSLGILLYTIIHMVRARLVRNVDDEEVAALIEATRANIAPMIGHAFYQLPKTRHNQAGFAAHALQIASTLADLAGSDGDEIDSSRHRGRQFISLPPDWDLEEHHDEDHAAASAALSSDAQSMESLFNVGDYHVFTREFDTVVTPDELYSSAQRATCRRQLDALLRAQAVSVARLALRLQRLFATPVADDWTFGQEEGWLDARRLTQLVSNKSYRQLFYQQRMKPETDVVVSFLIDNTGSMKSQRFETLAVLVDTFARALEQAGARSEILGFSTRDWNGGRAMKEWHKQRKPDDPGRLSETLQIVYKDADTSWRQARPGIASLLKTKHYREGVDGEALLWASQRLLARTESKRYLVMVSDGSPMDAATDNANRENFLLDHLCAVARHIDTRTPISLGCLGIDLDTSFFIPNSVTANLSGTLGNPAYRVLEELFAQRG